jgi:hypothetical protein
MAVMMKHGFKRGRTIKEDPGTSGKDVGTPMDLPKGLDFGENPDVVMSYDRERVEELWDDLLRDEEFFNKLLDRMKR